VPQRHLHMRLLLPLLSASVIVGVSLLFFGSARAEPSSRVRMNDKAPHLRVGVSIRKIGVKFSISPNTDFVSSLTKSNSSQTTSTGLGDVGLFNGGSNVLTYSNGTVGGDASNAGEALTTVNGISQFSDPGRTLPSGFDFPLQQVQFTSTGITVSEVSTGTAMLDSIDFGQGSYRDENIEVGALVQLILPCYENENGSFLNATLGYTFFDSKHGSGPQNVGTLNFQNTTTITTTTTTYNYRYDYVGNGNQNGSFPYTGNGVIYDIGLWDLDVLGTEADLIAPEQTSISDSNVISSEETFQLTGLTHTNVNIDFHEIPIGFECGCPLGDGKIAFIAGLTLNVVDVDTYNRTDWYRAGFANPILSQVFQDSDTSVKPGAYIGANFTYPLTEDGRTSLEFHGSYRWVDSISATMGSAHYEIDLSSLEGGVSIETVF
jgi:hypothetical protein